MTPAVTEMGCGEGKGICCSLLVPQSHVLIRSPGRRGFSRTYSTRHGTAFRGSFNSSYCRNPVHRTVLKGLAWAAQENSRILLLLVPFFFFFFFKEEKMINWTLFADTCSRQDFIPAMQSSFRHGAYHHWKTCL
jgi:hypothetical protein